MSSFDIEGLGSRGIANGLDGLQKRPPNADGFGDSLVDALRDVDRLQDQAAGQADALARGEPVELHDLMVSMEKSDVAFQMMLEVRNKLLDAWDTLTRTSV